MYTDHHVEGYTEKQERERQHQQALADLFKTLEQWQTVFRTRLEMWGRNGPSPALRAQISEAAEHVGNAVDAIMNSTPVMLSAPTARNRY